ncbi:MAG TPA: LptE family protein [Bacteroidia bacterium]|nr:LptE family protein [Bacteroidia bacterium]HNP99645.1 LptE family protein [Bacteroidia bacterium]
MKKSLIILLLFAGFTSCKVNYSLSGASISPDVKTLTVKFFQKTAALGPASLSQTFTEALKDKFISQTNLSIVDREGDLTFEGSISNYTIQPLAIQANETAAKNRLSITVNVKFTNIKDEKQNFETGFTRYADFESSQNISSVEDQLIKEIDDQLVDDIFNKAVINW